MSFKKPFRAVPIRPGPNYRPQRKRSAHVGPMKVLGGAVGLGLLAAIVAQVVVPAAPEASPDGLSVEVEDQASLLPQPLVYDRGMSAQELDAQQPSAGGLPGRASVRAPSAVASASSWSYRNCAQARAAGAAPIRRGEPGYGAHMDGDGDGVACEPYRGR